MALLDSAPLSPPSTVSICSPPPQGSEFFLRVLGLLLPGETLGGQQQGHSKLNTLCFYPFSTCCGDGVGAVSRSHPKKMVTPAILNRGQHFNKSKSESLQISKVKKAGGGGAGDVNLEPETAGCALRQWTVGGGGEGDGEEEE